MSQDASAGTTQRKREADSDAIRTKELVGLLRQVRSAAQYLDAELGTLEAQLAATDAAQRWAALKGNAAETRQSIAAGTASAAGHVEAAAAAVESSSYLRDWTGDEVTRLQLLWLDVVQLATSIQDDLTQLGDQPDQGRVDRLLRQDRACRHAIGEIVVLTAKITIPERLNQFLDDATVGRSLSFKSLFEDELPSAADRAEVLRQIDESPGYVHGIVDIATGTVVAVSPNPWRRRRSYLLELVVLGLGGVLAFFVVAAAKGYVVLDPAGLRPLDPEKVSNLTGVLFTFVGGAGFHFVIDLLKAQQGAVGAPTWTALDDWLLWMHAREMKIITSIISLWFVFGAVLLVYPGDATDPLAAFFAGYSFDSLVDVLVKRFDALAAPQLAQVKEAVAGPATT